MKRICVGIVGASAQRGWASRAHLPALLALDEFEVAAVCTTRQESADEAARKYGAAKAYSDINALVADKDIDLISVCVRVDRHYGPVMAALEAGKHVFCEWPLGLTTREAEEMAALARRRGVVTRVGLQTRLSPVMRRVSQLIADGYIGELRSVTALSATTQWGASLTSEFAYGADATVGVNVFTIHAAHLVDALCDTLGEFSELSAIVTNLRTSTVISDTGQTVPFTSPDQIVINGRLSGGAVVALHLQSGVASQSGLHLEIRGTDGEFVITSDGHIPTGTLRLRGARSGETLLRDIEIPAELTSEPLRGLPQAVGSVGEAYRLMAAAIRGEGVSHPNFDDAVARHRLMDAIRDASATGRRTSGQDSTS